MAWIELLHEVPGLILSVATIVQFWKLLQLLFAGLILNKPLHGQKSPRLRRGRLRVAQMRNRAGIHVALGFIW